MRPVTKRVAVLRDVLVVAALSLLFLGLAECALRAAGLKFEGSFYTSDPELGYALRPNAQGWNISENVDYFQVNSDGLADREHSLQRPPGVIRIAMVGDSVTEAKHVTREQAYWGVMEQVLNSRLAKNRQRVEVINFGVAGYGLAQESIVIQKRVWKYDPQIIVLAGTIESFVLRSTRRLTPSKACEHVPFYVLKNGELAPDPQPAEQEQFCGNEGELHKVEGDMMNAIRLLGLVGEGLEKAKEKMRAELNNGRKVQPVENPNFKETDSFLGPASPDLKAAWDVSEALILRSRDAARQHHAEFWFFTLDMPEQVDPDSRKRADFGRSLGLKDLFLTDHLFANFAASESIQHGTLAPGLLAFAEKNNAILHGFPGLPQNQGHWNQTGHRVAGEMMARQLLESSPLLASPLPAE